MKKILSLRAWSAASLMAACVLLASCVLTLESPPEDKHKGTADPEDVGFDEPYTLETQYGDCTFQYAERTQVLKKKALDYLVKVEHDSILYFTDNIPKELLIQPGYYVSMVATHEIPLGLNAKVIELSQKDGMYKMVTTSATLEEVFEVYNVDFDCRLGGVDFLPLADSAEMVAQGINVDTMPRISTALLDGYEMSDEEWNYSPQTDPDYEEHTDEATNTKYYVRKRPRTEDGGAMRRRVKSGEDLDSDEDDQGNKDGGSVEQEKRDKYYEILSISTTDATWMKRIPTLNKYVEKGLTLACELGYGSRVQYSTRIEVDHKDPSKTLKETKVRDHSYFALKPSVTFSKYKSTYNVADNYQKIKPDLNLAKRPVAPDNDWMKGKFHFGTPVPGLIITILITPTFSYEIGIYGSAEVRLNLATTETYTKYIGNEKVAESQWTDPANNHPTFSIESASFGGFMEVKGGVKAFIAGTLGASAGAGIGGHISASIKLLAEYDFLQHSEQPKNEQDVDYVSEKLKNVRMEFNATLQGFVGLYLGGKSCQEVNVGPSLVLGHKNFYCYPDIGADSKAKVLEMGNDKVSFEAKYSFLSSGWLFGLGVKSLTPKLRVSLRRRSDYETVASYLLDEANAHKYEVAVEKNRSQTFRKEITLPSGTPASDYEFVCMPILHFDPLEGSGKLGLIYNENAFYASNVSVPVIVPSEDTYLLAKKYDQGNMDFTTDDNGDYINLIPPTYKYTIGMVADIYNTQYFKDVGWTEWGIEVDKIEYYNVLTGKHVPEEWFEKTRWKVDPKKGDGKYLFKISVTTDKVDWWWSVHLWYKFYYIENGKRKYVKDKNNLIDFYHPSDYVGPNDEIQQGPTTAKGLTLGDY